MYKVASFRELLVWQRGMDLVVSVYQASGRFPKTETFGLIAQVRRSVVSIPSNIAEGHTRESTKEFLNHLSMAQASLAEVQTQVEIAGRLEYLNADEVAALIADATVLAKQLFALRNALVKKP
jgi:four helix bundle protein